MEISICIDCAIKQGGARRKDVKAYFRRARCNVCSQTKAVSSDRIWLWKPGSILEYKL
jgi:hypothetical protein